MQVYVEIGGRGLCIVTEAKTVAAAEREARREFGTDGEPYTARRATEDDIAWYEGMAGVR